jgi:hypothetical protein
LAHGGVTGRKKFFSEEKNQKTFTSGASGIDPDLTGNVQPVEESKVFWFLFFKKEVLALSPLGKRPVLR